MSADTTPAKVLMVMGTSSSAGKSLVTTALCRCIARRGFRVAPFKSQNMSNNAAVCADGGEIGRSQALQAIAAGVPPQTDMNPVLLKPEGETRPQVIINGKATAAFQTDQYFKQRHKLWPKITEALDRLRAEYQFVIIEGAGSPAELNLCDVDMVNMSVAKHCAAPVILVGDIERGGVFAQLLGTLWLLPEEDRNRVCGLLVNKFRGDLSLFDRGVELLEDRGGVPVLGVLPWIDTLQLPEEDAVALDDDFGGQADSSPCSDSQLGWTSPTANPKAAIDIAVIQLPHIANFDDFAPLAAESCTRLRYVKTADQLGKPDVVILPGTKNTLADLRWLKDQGLAQSIVHLSACQTQIVGICGGYQILGETIDNPCSFEGGERKGNGLGLLKINTCYQETKQTCQSQFRVSDNPMLAGLVGETVSGYEIHVGKTRSDSPWLQRLTDGHDRQTDLTDGAHSRDGRIWGCYLHGLFANDVFRRAFLEGLGASRHTLQTITTEDRLQSSLNRLADVFEASVDVDQLIETAFEGLSTGDNPDA